VKGTVRLYEYPDGTLAVFHAPNVCSISSGRLAT
jgi:hypothetical protein